jgi:hypothetical protein
MPWTMMIVMEIADMCHPSHQCHLHINDVKNIKGQDIFLPFFLSMCQD